VGVNVGGGEGGIREVEKDYGGGFILREGRTWSIGESEFTVEFTVHRGAEEVLGSEG
jgi:hypothetical protein